MPKKQLTQWNLIAGKLTTHVMLAAPFVLCLGVVAVSAADPVGTGQSSFNRQTMPPMSNGAANAGDPLTTAGVILREGTRVGPVTGRFVLSGHRWRFLPEQPDAVREQNLDTLVQHGLARKPTQEEETLLGKKQPIGRGIGTFDSTNLEDPDLPITPAAIAVPMTLVTENLMLDRISRAIEEDSNDDRWTITGYVTEFRDENRLVIETTVRAPMVPLSKTVLGGR
ncbi:hypothetical protein [Rhodopirellula baltica]|uniref:Uncharacterized protein n=1 Tax=Rhodopirellula baltica WH47 TaxID=991778 RepID=F2AZQ2_RHOBT|nr:hypothetical protein [Rhodopirellula baltica]EGF24842.1 hypothetical protein RBWH47_05288 [Rhodopirellula baltica WH47]